MTSPTPSFPAEPSDRVCAVVTTFFPDAGFPERLERIAAQLSRVIVVDNCTTGEIVVNLERALGVKENILCIRNHENLGVATARNQGICQVLAEERDCDWIVTFDQNSLQAGDMVERMLTIWKSQPYPEKLMVAGPRTVFFGSTPRPHSALDGPWREALYVITSSGRLFSQRAFEVAGYK